MLRLTRLENCDALHSLALFPAANDKRPSNGVCFWARVTPAILQLLSHSKVVRETLPGFEIFNCLI
jgi:hypothetical protein